MARRIEKVIPAFEWLRHYENGDLSKDLSSGLIVAVVLVPQAMAYALLAGLPPIYGLYASVLPAIVYALFGTSRHMPVGPAALIALLTFSGVSALAQPGSARYVSLALLLALMVGVLQLTMGLLRMGFMVNFIPGPVLSGFVYASAVVIAVSQLKNLLGVHVSAGHSGTVTTVLAVARKIGETNLATLGVGLVSIAALVILPRLWSRLPAPLVVAVVSTLAVYLLGLHGKGVAIVSDIPRGLPAFSLPSLDPDSLRALLPSALTVTFVGFISSISVAKAIAARERYKIDAGGELRALGLSNVAAAFSSGFPVAGSFSRTAVQHRSGARTQLSSVVTAFVIVATLLFLTPLFYYLPKAALAAIIVTSVRRLIDIKEAGRVYELRRADGMALTLTFLLTLLWGLEQGIILGALFSLLSFVRRTAYPDVTELGYVEEEDAFLGLRSHPEARTYHQVLIVRFDASLYYANVSLLEEWLLSAVAERSDLEWIVIDCRGMNTIDVTAIESLENLVSEYRSRSITVLFTHANLPVRERLKKADREVEFSENASYQTTRDALEEIGLLESLDTSSSAKRGSRHTENSS